MKRYRLDALMVITLGLLSIEPVYAVPLWTYSAPSPRNVTVPRAGVATVTYTITNNSSRTKNLILAPTPGLSSSGCTLPGNGLCTLKIQIKGSELPQQGIHGGPHLCESNNLNQCYEPGSGKGLNINYAPVLPAIASGYYSTPSTLVPLLVSSTDGGATWTYRITSNTPTLPADLNGSSVLMYGATCYGTHCIATGYYDNGGTQYPLLANSTDSGVTWAYRIDSSTPTLPADFTTYGYLWKPHCRGSNCIVPGGYGPFVGLNYFLLAQSSDYGMTWSYRINSTTPTPPADYWVGGLSDISSNEASFVVAGGYKALDGIHLYPLLVRSTDGGVGWTYLINSSYPTLPADYTNDAFLYGISCSGSYCVTGGMYSSAITSYPLLANSTDGGGTWTYRITSSTPALPADFSSSSYFNSVSCSGLYCVAGGGYSSAIANYPLLANSTDGGGTWTYRITSSTPALPADYTDNGIINIVSCSDANCIAVGQYTSGAVDYPLIASSTDGGVTWKYTVTSSTPTLPAGYTGAGSFDGASCNGAYCIASGGYNIFGNYYPLLAASTDGGVTWAYKVTANTPTPPADFRFGRLGTSGISSQAFLPDSLEFLVDRPHDPRRQLKRRNAINPGR